MSTETASATVVVRCQKEACGHYSTFRVEAGESTADGSLAPAFWARVRCPRCGTVGGEWNGVLLEAMPERRRYRRGLLPASPGA